jgi:hypothetical protein
MTTMNALAIYGTDRYALAMTWSSIRLVWIMIHGAGPLGGIWSKAYLTYVGKAVAPGCAYAVHQVVIAMSFGKVSAFTAPKSVKVD